MPAARSRRVATLAAVLALTVLPRAVAQEAYTESDFLSRVRRLTFEGRRAGEGYFRPDGEMIVFQSEREPDNPFYQIYTLDLTTGDSRRISPGHPCVGPSISARRA